MSEFKKRLLTAYYDTDSGELRGVDVSKEFGKNVALFRADVLKDLLEFVTDEYVKAADGIEEEYQQSERKDVK